MNESDGRPDGVSLRTKSIVELRKLHRQAGWLLSKLTSKEWVKSEYLATAADQADSVSELLDLLSRGIDPEADFNRLAYDDLR
jgi:hypothetical protein